MTHPEHEDFPWTVAVVDHPPRTESAQYRASRRLMRQLVGTTGDWTFAPGPYEDHHGGGVWVRDDDGWFCLLMPLGIEWSAQFCADPAKVDRARRATARVVRAYPKTLPGYLELGYDDGERLLATPIETSAQVSEWTDSIFNASVPLPRGAHSGVLPSAAGYHHYPKPIVDIDHFRYDDFQLFVTDTSGFPAVVVPLAPRGSGDGRVRLLAAHPGSPYAQRLLRHRGRPAPVPRPGEDGGPAGGGPGAPPDTDRDILPADDPAALAAFAQQR